MTMSDSEGKAVDQYYCPKCLDWTYDITVPRAEGFMECSLNDGECIECYLNLGRRSRYHFIGRVTLDEAQEFLKDPARKLDPLFDQEAYDARENYVPIQYEDLLAENEKIRKRSGGYAVVECPYCHSKNTTQISSVSKALNTAMFGILGNKRNQQWHCNNCDSDF